MEDIIVLFNRVTEKLEKELAIRIFVLAHQLERDKAIRLLQGLFWRYRFKKPRVDYCLCWWCCKFYYWQLQSTLSITTA
ncbi:ORF 2 [Feline immunodeficiency virus]|uniref:Probable Vpr-like protein n=1 Tax=Feline immunodeficiency virus (isolate Petaluma) TaxID=11674 RepID=VPRL_FIVPE|nr:ORF 2 [Feline immunodeficiency virus]Q66013.1 RecName: Full=Probable Vpr-like protein; AltName: Full=ORF2; AltName: Full=OrfA; AltName: Full=Protein Tat [Feline immunodeficiency virus (isolate Petaluma)]AAB59939.1 ORF 2 [Feline immunodeficiency virus]